MSPGGAACPEEDGDNEPPERSLRKDGSLTQERSLRVSSSEDSMSPPAGRRGGVGGEEEEGGRRG